MAANPFSAFVTGILSKWYLLMAGSSLVVMFWIFKGLDDVGIIDSMTKTLTAVTQNAKSVAKNCTPLIKEGKKFVQCLNNPPSYKETEVDAQGLQWQKQQVELIQNQNLANPNVNNPSINNITDSDNKQDLLDNPYGSDDE
jgi:hypothetical protein